MRERRPVPIRAAPARVGPEPASLLLLTRNKERRSLPLCKKTEGIRLLKRLRCGVITGIKGQVPECPALSRGAHELPAAERGPRLHTRPPIRASEPSARTVPTSVSSERKQESGAKH